MWVNVTDTNTGLNNVEGVLLQNVSEPRICSSALKMCPGKTLVLGVSPNSLNHESFLSRSLGYRGPFGDTLYRVVISSQGGLWDA